MFLWSCRESNPGPNIFAVSFLHVYLCIDCRERAGAQQTNSFLRWMILSSGHIIPLQHSVFVLSRRRNMVTELTCSAAHMDVNLSIKQPWHTEYCHIKFSYSYYTANYATQYMLTLTKIYAVKTGQPRLFFKTAI